jgi:hypothetical protein
MALLLEQQGDEVKITEEVVKLAACNPGRKWALQLLIGRSDTVYHSRNPPGDCTQSGDKETLQFLLERDPTLLITYKVLLAAACNFSGKETV